MNFCSTGAVLAVLVPMLNPTTAWSSDSLVIATYNSHLVPDTLRCAEQVDIASLIASGAAAMVGSELIVLATALPQAAQLADCMLLEDDISYREAGPIAAEILRHNFDVIALTEVFDEDARERLLNDLSTAYPFAIEYINSGPDLEDSGLMLFSKFPFGDLANQNAVFTDGTVHGSTDQVAFIEYDECSDFDCLTSKGAAFVKILNTRPGATIPAWDVVFTHMQAAYDADEEYRDDRKGQFAQIQSLIRDATLGGEQTPLFIVGDLNVEGEGAQWDATTATASVGGGEWKDFAGTANGDPMATDAWATTTSSLDIGITNHLGKLGDMRLDYVLNTQIENSPCIQHLTRAYLGNSDHIAVIANTNRRTDFCSPRTAWDKPSLDTPLRNPAGGSTDRTRIGRPGAMQWYFVELPEGATGAALGTTRPFDPLTGTGVMIELFSPQDLTTPIAPTSRKTFVFGEVTTQKYVLPRTFYVRVFSPTPSWTGEYDLFIHRLLCANAEEACPIRVNDPRRYTVNMLFNPGIALGPEDTAWFEIAVTDRADSGKEQTLHFVADEFDGGLLIAELREQSSGNPPLTLNSQTETVLPGSAEITGAALGPLTFYLTLRRNNLAQGTGVRVGWKSNLTRLGGVSIGVPGVRSANLICDDETNGVLGSEAGEDEISLLVRVDKTAFREVIYHEFDCNHGPIPLFIDSELGTIRFIDEVIFTLFERDTDTIINPDDESQWIIQKPLPIGHFLPSQDLQLGESDVRVVRSTEFAKWDFEGGKYHLEYNLSHQGFR